jgi:hypothetical protein
VADEAFFSAETGAEAAFPGLFVPAGLDQDLRLLRENTSIIHTRVSTDVRARRLMEG